jgi:ATP-binding cassette, subfamily B, heavy metal transporter
MTTTSQQHPLRRFLPYLWPADKPGLKLRVVSALILVLIAKATMLIMPFAYKGVIDSMATPTNQGFLLGVGLVFAYAAARFGGVLFDNIRNVIFERVGQTAGADLAGEVFTRIHDLSLRFHLERRTGALTRIIERGTKSVDTMLYFLAFNIAPTILELTAVCVIFQIKMGFEIVAATLVIVALYIWLALLQTLTRFPRLGSCTVKVSCDERFQRTAFYRRGHPMGGALVLSIRHQLP